MSSEILISAVNTYILNNSTIAHIVISLALVLIKQCTHTHTKSSTRLMCEGNQNFKNTNTINKVNQAVTFMYQSLEESY